MNKFTFLFCLILLIVVKSEAQQQTSEPIKNKSNRIILHFRDTTGLFTRFGKELIDRGYELETKDRELGIIKTKTRSLPGGWSHIVQIKSLFRDSTITISATQPNDFSWDIFYITRKSTFNETWKELMLLANKLTPDAITYSEQK